MHGGMLKLLVDVFFSWMDIWYKKKQTTVNPLELYHEWKKFSENNKILSEEIKVLHICLKFNYVQWDFLNDPLKKYSFSKSYMIIDQIALLFHFSEN